MKKKLFKNKIQMVSYIIITIIILILFIIIGKTDYKKKDISDNEKFSNLYNLVDKNNIYKIARSSEVLEIVDNKSGVILMGFPTNKWTNYYAKLLNDVAKEVGLKEILYYDFLQDREENNGTYETIVNRLKAYVTVDDEGSMDIYAPTVIVVKNGEVIGYFNDTAIMQGITKPEIYYNEYNTSLISEKFKTALTAYME